MIDSNEKSNDVKTKTLQSNECHQEFIKNEEYDYITLETLLSNIENMLNTINYNIKSEQVPYGNLYNVSASSTVATPNQPESPDVLADSTATPVVPGYDRYSIYESLKRNSRGLSIINDGPATLYIMLTPNGEAWSLNESVIYPGEARRFFDVYELGIRCTIADNDYRITEYEYSLTYRSNTPNKEDVSIESSNNIAVLGVGTTQLPNIVIPKGYNVVIRADPANAGIVYISNSIARLGVATTRAPLAAGDSVVFGITNVNILHVAGSVAGQNVNMFVEQ